MGVPTTEQYAAMLDVAVTGGYACPAINVTSSVALNAAIRGFAEAGSDGIVELTTDAGQDLAGAFREAARGARALAAFAHEVGLRRLIDPWRAVASGPRRMTPLTPYSTRIGERGGDKSGLRESTHVRSCHLHECV